MPRDGYADSGRGPPARGPTMASTPRRAVLGRARVVIEEIGPRQATPRWWAPAGRPATRRPPAAVLPDAHPFRPPRRLAEPQPSCSVPDTRVKEVRPAGRRREIQLSVEGGAIQNEREVDRDPARRRPGGPDAPLGDDRAPGLFAVDHPLNRATGIGYAAGAGHGRCALGFWGGQGPRRGPPWKPPG